MWEKYYGALKQQDWPKALAALNSIKQQKGQGSQVYLKLGDLLQRMGNTNGAVEAYHKAAVYLVKEGFTQKAAAIFKIILRIDPKNSEASAKLQRVIEIAFSAKGAFFDYVPATFPEISAVPDKLPEPVYQSTGLAQQAESAAQPEKKEYEEVSLNNGTAEVDSYGNISLPDAETKATENSDKERELGPGYGEITLDEEEISEGRAGLLIPERTGIKEDAGQASERYKDFDNLLSDAAKELPFIEEKPGVCPSIPSILIPIGEDKATEFTGRATNKTYKSGDRIVTEGEIGDSLYFIKEGKAKVIAHIMGKEFVLATLGNGDVFGEVAFLVGRPRTASVIADGDIEVMEFDHKLIEDIISKHPELLECLHDLYNSRVSSTLKKVTGK